MSQPAIVFDSVWKKFFLGERHTSLRDLVPAIGRSLTTRRQKDDLQQTEFWALRDVSFDVEPGEALGIIGPNGAGKSTTLKLLTRIFRPTRGCCELKGRVGALIEVAAGFHPDLTGRENVFLQGAIMGMKRSEIARKLDAIVDFSGLHNFIDTQVKRYSSGMNARLGFSIAANLEPDVLIIDEVLAVGDMAFQQRCIDRMQEFKRGGVAIAFVSHNLQAVSALCTKALFLNHVVEVFGTTPEVIRAYVAHSTGGSEQSDQRESINTVSATLLASDERLIGDSVKPGDTVILRVTYLPFITEEEVIFDFQLFRCADDLLLYEAHFASYQIGVTGLLQGKALEVDFPFRINLAPGEYRVVTRIRDTTMFSREFLADASRPVVFRVASGQRGTGIADLASEVVIGSAIKD